MSSREAERNPIEELADEFLERYRRGERPSLSEYTRRHPELAEEIRDLFPALVTMEEAGPKSGEADAARKASSAKPFCERLGDYRLLREVGRGGMGIVYEAEQESLGRHVALKVLPSQASASPLYLQRFRREARSAARLHHTNIVPVFDVGEFQGIHYYAMQFIQGQGLDEVLDELRQLRGVRDQGRRARGENEASAKYVGLTDPNLTAALAHGLLTDQFAVSEEAAPFFAPVQLTSVETEQRDGRNPGIRDQESQVGGYDPGNGSSRLSSPTSASRAAPLSSRPSSQSDLSTQSDYHYYRSVARIGLQAAEALAYAHAQKVLHRDIKPANLLLDLQGTVWVTDFGLAKEEGDDLTHTGDVVGTLQYMAPERFGGVSDAKGDIYSLGLTLYELLTLRPAFRETDRGRLIKRITHDEPPRPRKLDPRAPRDLETIVLKATFKEPRLRYQSAEEMCEDLRRFLADRPIRARRSAMWEHAWRWCRRNPALAVLGGLAAAALLAALGLGVGFAAYQYRAAGDLRAALLDSQRLAADLALDRGLERCARGDCGEGMLWLGHSLQMTPNQADRLEHAIRLNLGAWRRCLHVLECVREHPEAVSAVAVAANGKTIATGSMDGNVRLWDADTGQPKGAPLPHRRAITSATFSVDGRTLLTCDKAHKAYLWNTATGQSLGKAVSYPGPILAVHFAGRPPSLGPPRSVSVPDSTPYVATMEGKRTIRLFEGAAESKASGLHHDFMVRVAAFTPDGKHLLTGGGEDDQGQVRLWDLDTGHVVHTFAHEGPVEALAVSRDGTRLLTGTRFWKAHLWDLAKHTQIGTSLQHAAPVRALAFSSAGEYFLTGCADGKARVWQTATMRLVGQPLEHQGPITALTFNAGDKHALTASADRTARLWRLAPPEPAGVALPCSGYFFNAMAFDPAGKILASAGDDKTVRLWDTATGKAWGPGRLDHPDEVHAVAFSGDGSVLVSGCDDGNARLWEAATGKPRGPALQQQSRVRCVAVNEAGSAIVTAEAGGVGVLRSSMHGEALAAFPHKSAVGAIALSPNGQLVLTGAQDGTARLWTINGEPSAATLLHRSFVRAVAFSRDSTMALTGSADTTARLWDVRSGKPRGTPLRHQSEVRVVAFCPDGKLLATGDWEHVVRLWDEATRKPIGPPLWHRGAILALTFPGDGASLLSASTGDNRVRRWPVPTPFLGDRTRIVLWTQVATGLELDPAGGVLVLDTSAWQERRRRLDELGGMPLP
jgi:WD40 repeat protein/serine/threonine protein kinase